MRVEVIMPQLGETVSEGTVLAWRRKPGEYVNLGEPLLEVESDKATMEIPAPAAGVLQEILVGVGIAVSVGTVLAVLGTHPMPAQGKRDG